MAEYKPEYRLPSWDEVYVKIEPTIFPPILAMSEKEQNVALWNLLLDTYRPRMIYCLPAKAWFVLHNEKWHRIPAERARASLVQFLTWSVGPLHPLTLHHRICKNDAKDIIPKINLARYFETMTVPGPKA